MSLKELIRSVRRIQFKSQGLTNQKRLGEVSSSFKGFGMNFSEVREYQFGDETRFIDWNVTARYNRPHVKVFEEEREQVNMLMIDVSKSMDFQVSIYGNKASANLKVDRTDFGIKYGSGSYFEDLQDKMIYDEFDLNIDLEF